MHSFTEKIRNGVYHVYRGTSWNNIAVNQADKVMKETNEESFNIDPCCKIAISRLDKIGPVAIATHTNRNFDICSVRYMFLQEGGSITGSVADILHYPVSHSFI